ncbi:hypothetical protein [Bradyrhizobium sp.]|uniref:hypothetical protein n=1 Tax=Bradyrhizobium sp. TaxID=376 RepID=UPI001D1AFDEB|nr:hypothetical protein [Bradyrhizobium sp.]MBI5320883.1 hypothetical protein [Bradyrhizobium sp.]
MTKHSDNIYPFFSIYDGQAYLKKRQLPRGGDADMFSHTFTDTYVNDHGQIYKTVTNLYSTMCDAAHHDQALYIFHAEYVQRTRLGKLAQNVTLHLDGDRPHFTITDAEGAVHTFSLAGRSEEEMRDDVITREITHRGRQIYSKWFQASDYDAEKIVMLGTTITG